MFNIYYHKHKDEMDKQTTHLLNKKFSINGYRITKIKGVLCLKKWTKNKSEPVNVEHTLPGKQMFDDINDLQDRIQKLEEVVNNIIDVINQLKVA